MINELLFFLHLLVIINAALGALWLGKEALICLIALFAIVSNLFVTKQIMLFGFSATATDSFAIGIVLSLNLLQEYYGKEITKKAIWVSFATAIIYTIFSQLHLLYMPAIFDTMHPHAVVVFGVMPRIMIASITTYFIVQRLDCILYEFLKRHMQGNYLVWRNYCSVLCSQLLDTVLFSFLGLYGLVESILPIMVISYCIKLIAIIVATPFVRFSKKLMEKKSYESISL